MQTDNLTSNTENSNPIDANKIDTTKKVVIKINDEYKQLISQLTSGENEILKKSISENKGNVVPIILNKQGVILDGYHRYRACKELGIDPKIEIKEFSDPIDEKEFIIIINLNRRQLNSFQIAELGVKLEEIEKENAKLRLSKAGKIGSDIRWKAGSTDDDDDVGSCNGVVSNGTTLSPIEEEKGKTLDIVAKKIGLSPSTYFKARKIVSESAEEQKQRLREGKDKIDKIYKDLQKEKKKSEISNLVKQSSNQVQELSPQNNNNNNDTSDFPSFKLLCGHLSEKGKEISSNSVDLILTDPHYSSEFISVYSDLAILASRVLKPGGSLVTYFGQHILPQVLEIFVSNNLKYWWLIAVKQAGTTKAFQQRQVFVMWKPLLWFVKGEKISTSYPIASLNCSLYDYIESKPPDKILHQWEQSTVEAEHVIKKLSLENQTILDPLMDSGTTGLAAINLGRKFIGIEKDQEKFAIAKKRLENNINKQNVSNQS